MGISAQVKSVQNSFTDTELAIADYVLQNSAEVARMSIYRLAEITNVSTPTISRFIRKVGCPDFRDFKIQLVLEIASAPRDTQFIDSDSDSAMIDKVFFDYIQNLHDTRSLIDPFDFIVFCKKLLKARRIVFFGLGASNLVANYAALRFSYLDIQAEAYGDPMIMLLNAKRMDKKCIAVGISHSGETAATVKSIEISKANGAVTAGISNYIDSSLSRSCNHLFCTTYEESRVSYVESSSHVMQLVIIDAMYTFLAKNGKHTWNTREIDDITEALTRV